MKKKGLSGLDEGELLKELSLDKKFRATQIFSSIHSTGVTDIKSITSLPAAERERLSENYTVFTSKIDTLLKDPDGSSKLRIKLSDSSLIECVLLSDSKSRKTACISTQAGCRMGCRFCKTGSMGYIRNLDISEIVEQFLHLRKKFGNISNIVFMGMGEPLDNFDNLIGAVKILHNSSGINMGYRKMTVSTCGLTEEIIKLADMDIDIRLALSLNSADPVKRKKIMPVTAKHSLEDLKKALTYFQSVRNKRITLEYVMIDDFNISEHDAKLLKKFCTGLSVMVNLIPWNPAEDLPFNTPSGKKVDRFCSFLDTYSLPYSVRRKKGRSINGACGQLASS
jgi:23S rRNA (adenine2503-C2)-methyltransferase